MVLPDESAMVAAIIEERVASREEGCKVEKTNSGEKAVRTTYLSP